MDDRKAINKAVGEYLERVAAELAEMSPEERETILETVESHIYESLEARVEGTPGAADVERILAEMPRPESYAGKESAAGTGTNQLHPQGKLCRLVVAAAVWAPFGLFVALFFLHIYVGPYPPAALVMLVRTALVIGLAAPFGVTTLALLGISKIRASRGALTGMPLAVVLALLYPLVALTAAFSAGVGQSVRLFAEGEVTTRRLHNLVNAGAWLGVLIGVIVSLFVFRAVWRWAQRPFAAREYA